MKYKISTKSQLASLLKEASMYLGVDSLFLSGSTLIDFLRHNKVTYGDIDIVLKGKSQPFIDKCIKNLIKHDFEISAPQRSYLLYNTVPVELVQADNGKFFFDLAFIENPDLVGQFNISSIYCKYPELICIDKHNSIESIKKKQIRCIRDINSENPHLLLGRFLYLCSKYDIPIKTKVHLTILENITKRIETWEPQTPFHKSAISSLYSSIFKSLVKAANRTRYAKEIAEIGILESIFPELSHSLTRVFDSDKSIDAFRTVKDKKDAVNFFKKHLDKEEIQSYTRKIDSLRNRIWDKSDKRL